MKQTKLHLTPSAPRTISPLPLHAIWLDSDGVGAMLSYEARVVSEKIVTLPDFPHPARIGNKGRPRWRADEVNDWMEQWRDSR